MKISYIDEKEFPTPERFDYRGLLDGLIKKHGKAAKIEVKNIDEAKKVQANVHSSMRRYLPEGYEIHTTRTERSVFVRIEKASRNGKQR